MKTMDPYSELVIHEIRGFTGSLRSGILYLRTGVPVEDGTLDTHSQLGKELIL